MTNDQVPTSDTTNQADGPTETSQVEVIRNDEKQQYEGYVDGEFVGYATFTDTGDAIELPHTVVPEKFGGRGYASAIVRFALDDVRAQNRLVQPTCPYVDAWIGKHPEYADLVAK